MELNDKELLTSIRESLESLADAAGFDLDFVHIIHVISPFSDIDDYYKVTIKGETMFVGDDLEALLWHINQMPSR